MDDNIKMQSLDHVYPIGRVFSENELKDLKDEISLSVGAKLSKTTNNDEVRFICYQNPIKCQFVFRFVRMKIGKSNRNLNKGNLNKELVQGQNRKYQLVEARNTHQLECYWSDEEKRLCERKIQLVGYKTKILEIIRQMDKQAYPSNILQMLANTFNVKTQFLYEGFSDNSEYRRQIKKKFDNIVAEVKKDIHPGGYKPSPRYIVEQGSKPTTAILRRVTWEDKEDQLYQSNLKKTKKIFMGHSRQSMDLQTINDHDSKDSQWSPKSISTKNIKIQPKEEGQ